jgi:hypothetical protein
MQQVISFFYLMSVLALFIISVAKYKGTLNHMLDSIFWLLYIPMLVLVVAIPFVIKQENKTTEMMRE